MARGQGGRPTCLQVRVLALFFCMFGGLGRAGMWSDGLFASCSIVRAVMDGLWACGQSSLACVCSGAHLSLSVALLFACVFLGMGRAGMYVSEADKVKGGAAGRRRQTWRSRYVGPLALASFHGAVFPLFVLGWGCVWCVHAGE